MKDFPKLKIVTRYRLNKKDKKGLLEEVAASLGFEFSKAVENASLVEVAKVKFNDVEELYFLDGVIALLRFQGIGLVPSLYYIYKTGLSVNYPSVYVDSGAVPHILNGADVMIPGIKRVEGSFKTGEKVFVREMEKSRIIAIGVTLISSNEIAEKQKGKGVRTLHYLGDEVWKTFSA